MKRLSVNQITALNELLSKNTGGTHGIRDAGLLKSAVLSPFQTFGGEDLYPGALQKAARLCYALIKNHPFTDGNKRIGILAMLVFLKINGIQAEFTDKELSRLGWVVADGSISYESILYLLYKKI